MLYDFKCPECMEVMEVSTTMDKVFYPVLCPTCLVKMTRYYGNQRLNFSFKQPRKDKGEK